jgi:DtxR family Mn-dependent transcriptional regulator
MSDLSEFEEMYLKRIFEAHSAEPGEIVRTTKLAELMEVSPASTTEMIQRLSVRDYVTYIPYKGCRLTSEGFKHASRIKRREELLKILLTDVIRFDGDIDSVACKIEHSIDENLEASIDRMLGYPERNKDGLMIPSVDRSMITSTTNILLPLSALPEETPSIIELINSSSVAIKTLENAGVKIGNSIIKKSNKFYCEGSEIAFSRELSFKIIVRVE